MKSLKLYDKAGQLDTHLPLIDEIRIYLTNRQNKKQRTLGQELLDHFETPPYGWDPNAIRIGTAAMVRAGLIKIAFGKKVYTNPADTELVATMRNSKSFNKSGGDPGRNGCGYDGFNRRPDTSDQVDGQSQD